MPSVPCLSLPWLDMPGDTHTNGLSGCHHPVADLVVSPLTIRHLRPSGVGWEAAQDNLGRWLFSCFPFHALGGPMATSNVPTSCLAVPYVQCLL